MIDLIIIVIVKNTGHSTVDTDFNFLMHGENEEARNLRESKMYDTNQQLRERNIERKLLIFVKLLPRTLNVQSKIH